MGVEVLKENRTLRELADLFSGKLYVVGGAVRDALCGKTPSDIDIAAPISPKEAVILLKNSDFRVRSESARLGTLKIFGGSDSFEYTAFRTDSYPDGGAHAPKEVRFTDDVKEDAMRRDFTVNAVYYNITEGKIVDPLNGISDMQNMLLKTCREPEITLGEDGLRLLRLVRIAAETGFIIEQNTFTAAKNRASLLADISVERVREELLKILAADGKNGVNGGHYRGVKLMESLGLWEFVIPELWENKDFPQNEKHHKYSVLEHIFRAVRAAAPRVRLAALFHDVAKARCKMDFGNMYDHAEAGAVTTDLVMRRMKFPNAERERTVRLVENHMYDRDCNTGENKLRRFVQRNYDILDDLVNLKNADETARGFGNSENPSAVRLEAVRDKMLAEGVPMTLADLKVNGNDLLNLPIPPNKRNSTLTDLLSAAATDPSLLTRESQLEFLRKKRF